MYLPPLVKRLSLSYEFEDIYFCMEGRKNDQTKFLNELNLEYTTINP